MRRTVNVSRIPSPRRAITTPLKTWVRSLVPSRMRWWTSTVSPISKPGTSFFAAAVSTRAISRFFMALTFLLVSVLTRQARTPGPRQGLFRPPAGHLPVVAAQEHLGHLHAAEDARPGVLRVLQPAGVVVRLLRQ